MWDYSARAKRFTSVDPLTGKYPELTPYQFASNRPIDGIDQNGLEYSPAGQSLNGPRDATSVRMYYLSPVVQKNVSYNATQQLIQNKALQALQNAPVFKADNRSSQQMQADQQSASYNRAMQNIYNSDEGTSFQIFSGIGASAIGSSPELGTAYGVGHGIATGDKTEVAISLLTYGMYKGSSIFLYTTRNTISPAITLGENYQAINVYNTVENGTLPGSRGAFLGNNRLTDAQMLALTERHNIEFAQVYTAGSGKNGGGGFYTLYSGTKNSVQVPLSSNSFLISHTHPGGTTVPSIFDINYLNKAAEVGSPQRSSTILPSGSQPVRFNKNTPANGTE